MRTMERLRRDDERPSDDPVRREAYERALAVLGGRRCATSHLTDEQLAAMAADPTSENVGRPDLPGSSR